MHVEHLNGPSENRLTPATAASAIESVLQHLKCRRVYGVCGSFRPRTSTGHRAHARVSSYRSVAWQSGQCWHFLISLSTPLCLHCLHAAISDAVTWISERPVATHAGKVLSHFGHDVAHSATPSEHFGQGTVRLAGSGGKEGRREKRTEGETESRRQRGGHATSSVRACIFTVRCARRV